MTSDEAAAAVALQKASHQLSALGCRAITEGFGCMTRWVSAAQATYNDCFTIAYGPHPGVDPERDDNL